MGMQSGPREGVKSDINITPLVDVVLVLLIIFMVVTPMLQRGYETNVPPKVQTTAPPPMTDQIVVRLAADGGIFINKDQYASENDFAVKLRDLTRGREDKVVFFAADGSLAYDRVADFLDICNDNGAKNLGIVLDELGTVEFQSTTVE